MNVSLVALSLSGSATSQGIVCVTFSNEDYAGTGSGGVHKDADFTADVSAGQVIPPRAVSIDLSYKGARMFVSDVVCLDGVVNAADISGQISPGGRYSGKVAWNGAQGIIAISWELMSSVSVPTGVSIAMG